MDKLMWSGGKCSGAANAADQTPMVGVRVDLAHQHVIQSIHRLYAAQH